MPTSFPEKEFFLKIQEQKNPTFQNEQKYLQAKPDLGKP